MVYAIVFVGGVVCGFLVPRSKKSSIIVLGAGFAFMAISVLMAAALGYDHHAIEDLLRLRDFQPGDRFGLILLTAVAYSIMLAGLVSAFLGLIAKGTAGDNGQKHQRNPP